MPQKMSTQSDTVRKMSLPSSRVNSTTWNTYFIVFQVVEFTREDGSDIFLTVQTVWTFFEACYIDICKDL